MNEFEIFERIFKIFLILRKVFRESFKIHERNKGFLRELKFFESIWCFLRDF